MGLVLLKYKTNYSDPLGSKGPKLSESERHKWYAVIVGEDSNLHCVAQGYPVPSFR